MNLVREELPEHRGRTKTKSRIIKAFDLFSGIGGFRVGCDMAAGRKIRFVGSCEIDKYSNHTYSSIFDCNGEFHLDDIRSITRFPGEEQLDRLPPRRSRAQRIRETLPPFDLLTAGFPCQPHSLMGNRKGAQDDRGSLFFDIAEVLRAMQPDYFILENVRAIRSVNEGKLYADMLFILEKELGYTVRNWEMNAADYGTPQVRRRLFIIGSRSMLPEGLPPKVDTIHRSHLTTWHLLERNVGEKYYLSERILGTILKHQHKGYRRKAEINRLTARPLTRTMHKMHRASQDNYYSDDFILGRYDNDLGVVHPLPQAKQRIRRITPREALRIQSFPERLAERALASGTSDTQLYMQAGNAVPPRMVQAILAHTFVEAT